MIRNALAFSLLLFALAFAAACGGDGGAAPTATGPNPFPVPYTPIATTAGTAPTAAPNIRDADFEHYAPLNEFMASAGDVYASQIRYEDLTNDGRLEAMVYIASDGEGGDIAVIIYTYGAGGLVELKRFEPDGGTTIMVDILSSRVVTRVGVYQPGDPLCCPSQIKATLYDWNGTDFVPAFDSTQ